MASSLRQTYDWLAEDRANEAKTPASFGATAPADAVSDNTVRPVEFLVSVKDELTDSRTWLERQFAAIQAEHARRDLEMQREAQAAPISEAYANEAAAEVAATSETRVGDHKLTDRRVTRAGSTRVMAAVSSLRSLYQPYLGKMSDALSPLAPAIKGHGTRSGGRLRDLTAKSQAWMRASGEGLSSRLAKISAQMSAALRPGKDALSKTLAWSKTKAESLSPVLYARIAGVGIQAKQYASVVTTSAEQVFNRAKGARAGGESALSSPARSGETNLSQMLIIAGSVLLVCGALLLGGGLFLRGGTPVVPDTSEPITWSFEAPDQSLNRVIFTLSGAPESSRIISLSIGGENTLAEPLTGVEGIIKPDRLGLELQLILDVDKPALTGDTIPPQAPFKFIYAFPGEGLSPETFLEIYGGLTLNVRYEVQGKQRVVIQYLSPEMLQAQLEQAQAVGS